nr:c-type cytochrome [Methylomarinum sp. Ch1-1]MDP4520737.1 c-type cytochrome [Methylomarinum sp. Ch1-1]
MKKSIIAFACSFLALSSIQAQAADLEEGKAAFETCRGCHSAPNYSNAYPTYYVPKIGGQRAEYSVAALKAYKEKNRAHGTMKANAYDLSEQTIENIAAYIQANPGKKVQHLRGGILPTAKNWPQPASAAIPIS